MRLVVPSREQAVSLLSQLHSSAKLCARLVQLSIAACELLFSQMARSFFVPFCMTAAAACASIRVRACLTLMQTISLYNVLLPLSAAFPLHVWGTTTVGQDLPESLSINWSSGSPHLLVNSFTEDAGYQHLVDSSTAQYGLKHYTQPTQPPQPPATGATSCHSTFYDQAMLWPTW